jgi:hypothetical protein
MVLPLHTLLRPWALKRFGAQADKKTDLEGSAFSNLFVDPSAGIIQIRFCGSATI